MVKKELQIKIQGMTKDNGLDTINPNLAYDNRNIRIVSLDNNLNYTIVNEKSTKNTGKTLKGSLVGYTSNIEFGIVFTHSSVNETYHDRLYKIYCTEDNIEIELLLEGNYNFDTEFPIESFIYKEREDITKVYWTDGKNPLRMVVIERIPDVHYQYVDFNPVVSTNTTAEISKVYNGGNFPSGVIQYVFTYINKYAQETGIVYMSPLYYLSPKDRGGSPEEKVTNAFNINIKNVDTSFEYIRIYSIIRTSVDATPTVKVVTELSTDIFKSGTSITKEDNIIYTPFNLKINNNGVDTLCKFTLTVEDTDGNEHDIKINPDTIPNTNTLDDKVDRINNSLIGKNTVNNLFPIGFGGIYLKDNSYPKTPVNSGIYNLPLNEAFNISDFNNPQEVLNDMPQPLYSPNHRKLNMTVDGPEYFTYNDILHINKGESEDGILIKLIKLAREDYNDPSTPEREYFQYGSFKVYYHENSDIESIVFDYIELEAPAVQFNITYPAHNYDVNKPVPSDYVPRYDLYTSYWTSETFVFDGRGNTNSLCKVRFTNNNEGSKWTLTPIDGKFVAFVGKSSPLSEVLPNINCIPDEVGMSNGNPLKNIYYLKYITVDTGLVIRKYKYDDLLDISTDNTPIRIYIQKHNDEYYFAPCRVTWGEGEGDRTNIKVVSTNVSTSITAHPGETRGYHVYDEITLDNMLYTDTGTSGYSIDPTSLLYLNRDIITAKTMAHKDGRLFLGNVKLLGIHNNTVIKDLIRKSIDIEYTIDFDKVNKNVDKSKDTMYPYDSSLDKSSYDITTFKFGNYYRFGLQLQDKNGLWSNVYYIGDYQQDIKPNYPISAKVSLSNILSELKKDYIKARPVIVYPSINDRVAIAQGIVCPTVFNRGDRLANAPFSQMSWFSRPQIDTHLNDMFFNNEDTEYDGTGPYDNAIGDTPNLNPAEFRHFAGIKSNNSVMAEIQSMTGNFCMTYTKPTKANDVLGAIDITRDQNIFIDTSIVTLHSPDIDWNDDIQYIGDLDFRLLGYAELHNALSHIKIEIEGTTKQLKVEYKNAFGTGLGRGNEALALQTDIDSNKAWRYPLYNALWFDYNKDGLGYATDLIFNISGGINKVRTGRYKYFIYPWQREGSLNNASAEDSDKASVLKTKKMSYFKYSRKTFYTNTIWKPKYGSEYNIFNGTNGSGTSQALFVKYPTSSSDNIIYYPNINSISQFYNTGKVRRNKNSESGYDAVTGYPIFMRSYTLNGLSNDKTDIDDNEDGSKRYNQDTAPVSIKYKSNAHAIIAFNTSELDGGHTGMEILPSFTRIGVPNNNISTPVNFKNGSPVVTLSRYGIEAVGKIKGEYGYLWIGELYRKNIIKENLFGGISEDALSNNTWIIAGDSIELNSNDTLIWKQGDTYLQRYDALRVEPYTNEDKNQMIDIVSFICESYINADGRYDRNRKLNDYLSVSHINYNLINPIYSQINNFFVQRYTVDEDYNDNMTNQIIYSLSKEDAGEIDNWTKITGASYINTDSILGPISFIKRFNNELFVFQPSGVSQILYNSNVQISSTEGVPIEIANSGAVDSIRYISNVVGCSNKWASQLTKNGIYFLDSYNKDLYLFNGQLNNISTSKGMKSVFKNIKYDEWNVNNQSDLLLYENTFNDILCMINTEDNYDCLAYSELIDSFTSYYDYSKIKGLLNLKKSIMLLNNNDSIELHLFREGNDYNYLFDEYKPFHISFIANQDYQYDKMFSTIDFRADVIKNNNSEIKLLDNPVITPFSYINVWNEYQENKASLVNIPMRPSNLKQKFRVWRVDIPRNRGTRDRMRNMWLGVKLGQETPNGDKVVIHNMTVNYFV